MMMEYLQKKNNISCIFIINLSNRESVNKLTCKSDISGAATAGFHFLDDNAICMMANFIFRHLEI